MMEPGATDTECAERKSGVGTEGNEENEVWISHASPPSVEIVFLCASVIPILFPSSKP